MWRIIRIPTSMSLTIFGFEVIPESDIIDPRSPTAQKLAEEVKKVAGKETGWDRLKDIFKLDEFGGISPELDNGLTSGALGLLIGFFIGGIPASKAAHNDFIDQNKATSFETHFQAKEKLQFNVTKAMFSHGWRLGWRLGLFTGSYAFFTSAVATYRNKSSVLEYTAGGALAGAMYKFPMGPKAMVPGFLVGGGLGTIAGTVTYGAMMLSGTTAEEIRYLRKGWKETAAREMASIENLQRQKALSSIGLAHELSLIDKNPDRAKAGPTLDLSVIPDEETPPAGKETNEKTGNNKAPAEPTTSASKKS